MKNSVALSLIVFFPFLFVSCGNEKSGLPKSTGKTAEIIVVTDSKAVWKSEIGESIRQFFSQEYAILPQPEPLFNLINIRLEDFNKSQLFQFHHNIFIVQIDKKSSEPKLEVQKDHWTSPQRVVIMQAPNDTSLVNFFNEKKQIIAGIFTTCEHERLISTFKAFKELKVQNAIKENFHFTLTIPSGFYVAKKMADFAWIRKETDKNSQGLLIYTYAYTDTSAFSPERIISYRDTITKAYIPGPSEGSYMTVADEYVEPVSTRINFNGMFAVKTIGLWRLEGDFMGGPFINYTFIDEKRNLVVTIDGYVYAPNAPKRNLLMQLEAIIYSLKFDN